MCRIRSACPELLGADYAIENGRYRFAKIYDGENWNPQLRAPLTQPGVNVQAGEYLLAVNGRNITATENIHSFFQNTANKQIVIRVGPNPTAPARAKSRSCRCRTKAAYVTWHGSKGTAAKWIR